MIIYDENGHCISQFLKRYNHLKSAFTEFKGVIKSELTANEHLGISTEEDTETNLKLRFIDRYFLIEFSIVKTGEGNFLGSVVFSEINRDRDDEKIKIDQVYFDDHGNVKEAPSSRYSDINLKQSESSTYLFKYWFSKFIENNIEKV